MHSVTSNAVYDALDFGKTSLWSGTTSDGTEYSLSDDIFNYRFITCLLRTNVEYYVLTIPTSVLTVNTNYSQTIMGANSRQVTLPFPYQSTAVVNFPTSTKVKCTSYYNDANWNLKLVNVYGIGKK